MPTVKNISMFLRVLEATAEVATTFEFSFDHLGLPGVSTCRDNRVETGRKMHKAIALAD